MSLIDKAKGQPDSKKETDKIKSLQGELSAAQKLIDQQNEIIERLRHDKIKPLPAVKKTVKGGCFLRAVISDTHGSACDTAAFAAMISDLESLQVQELVHLGDAIDCGGFLAQHHTWGYVAESTYTYDDDEACANQHFDAICKVAKSVHYIEGNHERRIEKWCLTQALKEAQGKNVKRHFETLYSGYAVENALSLEKRGVKHYKQGQQYDGAAPATLKLGKAIFVHGHKCSKFATAAHAEKFSSNVFHGHTHRAQCYYFRNGMGHESVAWCHGCLCNKQPLWRHDDATNWTHGYGIQLVRPDGSFLPIHVPIINGKSYLNELADKLR